MPKLPVCYKWVLNEQDIKIRPDDLSLDHSRAKGKISDFDRNAIEAADYGIVGDLYQVLPLLTAALQN